MFTEKNKDLLMINHESAEIKSFDGVTNINFPKDMDLMQVANFMVSKKSEKRSSLVNLYKIKTGYCVYIYIYIYIYIYMNTAYLTHIYPQFISPKFKLPPKSKKPPSILLKYP